MSRQTPCLAGTLPLIAGLVWQVLAKTDIFINFAHYTMRAAIANVFPTTLFDGFDDVKFVKLVRSPMNYIGGKYKLLSQILRFFPNQIDTFVDLFCGGCNVGINVNANRVVFNDNLTYLVDLYRSFKEQEVCLIIEHIRRRIERFNLSLTNVDGYNELRRLYNTSRNPLDLFVLVAYSFNHQIRFNTSHQFNNPFGKERSSFNPTMEKNLIEFVQRLQQIDCEFSSLDFNKVDLSDLNSRDFVYCDPPYLITTGTYNDGKRGFTGWGKSQEQCLLDLLDRLNTQGVKFALSNVIKHKGKKNEILIDWINKNNYRVEHLSMNYANSNYHTSDRGANSSDEVLVLNYRLQ